jgi:hypothetical protein
MKARERLVITFVALLLLLAAGAEVFRLSWGSGDWLGRISLKWGVALLGFLLIFAALYLVVLAALWRPDRIAPLEQALAAFRERLGWLRWPLVFLVACAPAWFFLFGPWGGLFSGFYFRLVVFCSVAVTLAALLTQHDRVLVTWTSLVLGLLLVGVVFVLADALVGVTSYPFNLHWSEGNRLWDYSVLFGRELYDYPSGEPIPAHIDQGRQALWGLPFLLPHVSIVGARLWNAILLTLPYALLGWMAVRLPGEKRLAWFLFGLWTLIFLNQGPIYTPLVLSAVLIAGARHRPTWIALPLLFLASNYAYHSRLTWMFAPAMWGIMLIFGNAREEARLPRSEWVRAFMWGATGALGGYIFPLLWPRLVEYWQNKASADITERVAGAANIVTSTHSVGGVITETASRQTLLWYRLLPNATFGSGILVGLILASLPLVLFLVYLVHTRRWPLDFWRAAGVAGPTLAFLGVGLVASVKVGGGTNLHNMDMFLIGLAFAAVLAWEAGAHHQVTDLLARSSWVRVLLLLIVAVPAFTPMSNAVPLELPPRDKVDHALEEMQDTVACAKEHGDVLFMDQRQLLTFGFIQDVPLVPEFEKKQVMDQAIYNNYEYFRDFYSDLESRRFSLIITDRQAIFYKDSGDSLAEENNAWVQWVTRPIIEYYAYESVDDYKLVGTEMFMPIDRTYTCP